MTEHWSDKYNTPENICARCGHKRASHLDQPYLKGEKPSSDRGWCTLPEGSCIFQPCDCPKFVEPDEVIEVASVFDPIGKTIHLHAPEENSAGAIPDSVDLWNILWENRNYLGGVAHTHPWYGPASPSQTDITTFRAIEAGLGRWCLWPIITMDYVSFYVLHPHSREIIKWSNPFTDNKFWTETVEELRRRSLGGNHA